MAEEIGVAYLSIAPSLRGFKQTLEAAMNPDLESSGENAGKTLGQGISRGVSASAGAARAAGAQVGQAAAAGATEGAQAGSVRLTQVFSQFFRHPIQFVRDFGTAARSELDQIGGKSVALRNLGSNAVSAAGGLRTLLSRSTGLQAVRSAASGAVGSLGGISSLLGVAGPWGLALAGAGLALNGFSQAQDNARQATQALTDTLDAQTGALTAKSLEQIGAALQADITHADEWARLNAMGFGFETTLAVLQKGGPELDAYIAKLRAIEQAQGPNAYLAQALANSIQNQTEVMSDASDAARQHRELLAAVAQVTGQVMNAQDGATASWLKGTEGEKILAAEARKAADAIEAQRETLAKGKDAMYTMESAINKVREAIAKTPTKVTVTASGVGFTQLLAQIEAARKALALLTGKGYGDSVTLDGERHGLDASNPTKSQKDAYDRARKQQRQLRQAQRDLRKSMHDHNKVAADARASASGGGGGGGSAASKAETAMKQAKEQLRKDVGGGFIKSLLTATPSQIQAATRELIKGVKVVFSGMTEKRLVARIGRDNQQLKALAKQRKSVADQLSDATSDLANLRSAKKQFTDTFVSNTMGNISDMTLSAKGVQEFLNRRLTHLRAFKKAITTLAKRGLPQSLLNDLIAAGPEAAWKTAQNLAASDAATFSGIKTTALQLESESTSFGKTAAGMMYDSAIQAAKGLVDGLKSQQKAIEHQMLVIAKGMQKAIKKALGIKSPSRVFAAVGEQVALGMKLGIDRKSAQVNASVAAMAHVPSISAAPFHGGVRGGDSADIVAAVRALADRPQLVYIDGVLVGTTRAMSEVARSLAVS